MSDRENRTRRFDEICKTDNAPIDPCIPVAPDKLFKDTRKDPCDPADEIPCDYKGLREPSVEFKSLAPDDDIPVYRNVEIVLSCNQVFGDITPALESTNQQIVVTEGEFTSIRSQADADSQAQAVALTRLVCNWGNLKVTVGCEDQNGFSNSGGSAVVNKDTVRVKFDTDDYTLNYSSIDTQEARTIAADIKDRANENASNVALAQVNCFWGNANLVLNCHDIIPDLTTRTVPVVDPITGVSTDTNILVTADTGEILSDATTTVIPNKIKVFATDEVDNTVTSGIQEIVITQNYDSDYQQQADDQAHSLAESLLQCYFNNQETVIRCCEPFSPDDPSYTLTHDAATLNFYYDTHYTSGNPPNPTEHISPGFPSTAPDPQVFGNISLNINRGELKKLEPWIFGDYNAVVETNLLNGEPVDPKDLENSLLDCSEDAEPLDLTVDRQAYTGILFRTLEGFTNRCHNKNIDAPYADASTGATSSASSVTIPQGAFSSLTRGEAFELASIAAKAQLNCIWTNDFIEAATCPLDRDGLPVDPRSAGSTFNPVNDIGENQFASSISKADAQAQAEAANFAQLDCFWTNYAYDIRCLNCQNQDDKTFFLNQIDPTIYPPVYYRASNTLHVLYDHCGNRLETEVARYYRLYEAEFQRRKTLVDPGLLANIDAYLLNLPNDIVTITNPITGEVFQARGLEQVPVRPVGDPDLNYYDDRVGMDTPGEFGCLGYVQPVEEFRLWDHQNQVVIPETRTTEARLQVLLEAGSFVSRSSQAEANAMAEAFTLVQLNCFFQNELTDTRCEECDFDDPLTLEEYDFGAEPPVEERLPTDIRIFEPGYSFVPSKTTNIYKPDPRYSAANALNLQQECHLLVDSMVRSGYQANGTRILDKCNHSPDALVRIIVPEGVFRSFSTKAEANQLADVFAVTQLQCFWANPDVTRRCRFGAYHPVDCDGNFWEDQKCNSEENVGCTDDTTPCTEKYIKGAKKEVLLPKNTFQSYNSLDAVMALAKNIADAQLICTWGSDEITKSCSEYGLKPSLANVGNLTFPKDSQVSGNSYDDAQNSALNIADILSAARCFELSKYRRVTWDANRTSPATLTGSYGTPEFPNATFNAAGNTVKYQDFLGGGNAANPYGAPSPGYYAWNAIENMSNTEAIESNLDAGLNPYAGDYQRQLPASPILGAVQVGAFQELNKIQNIGTNGSHLGNMLTGVSENSQEVTFTISYTGCPIASIWYMVFDSDDAIPSGLESISNQVRDAMPSPNAGWVGDPSNNEAVDRNSDASFSGFTYLPFSEMSNGSSLQHAAFIEGVPLSVVSRNPNGGNTNYNFEGRMEGNFSVNFSKTLNFPFNSYAGKIVVFVLLATTKNLFRPYGLKLDDQRSGLDSQWYYSDLSIRNLNARMEVPEYIPPPPSRTVNNVVTRCHTLPDAEE
jgi:hypothetical protein